MATLKQCAALALQDLANQIYSGDVSAWRLADRIERRWRLHGATESKVRFLQQQSADYLKARSARLDAKFPDRLTYLHR